MELYNENTPVQYRKNPTHSIHLIYCQASIKTQFLKEDSNAIYIKTNIKRLLDMP